MYMKVSTSQFKAKMGKYMKAVRDGREVVVTDRDEPVARLIPYGAAKEEACKVSDPRDPVAPALGKISIRGIRYQGPSTSSLLMEDRSRR
jgi:prevent-host-death family protein